MHDSAIDQGGPDAVRCKPKAEGLPWQASCDVGLLWPRQQADFYLPAG